MENLGEILAKNPIVIDNVTILNITLRDPVQSKQALVQKINQDWYSIICIMSFLNLIFVSIGRPKYKALPIANSQEYYIGN